MARPAVPDDECGTAPNGQAALLLPVIVAIGVLVSVGLALLGRTWVDTRTTAAVTLGPLQILNGGFGRDAVGWAPVGGASLSRVPEHGGSMLIVSETPAAPVGAAAPAGLLTVGRLSDGATYRVTASLRLAKPGVRDIRLAVLGCVANSANSARSRDFSSRLSTNDWTTVSFDTRLTAASCTASGPTVQITARGQGQMLVVDDVSLART